MKSIYEARSKGNRLDDNMYFSGSLNSPPVGLHYSGRENALSSEFHAGGGPEFSGCEHFRHVPLDHRGCQLLLVALF